MSIIRKFTVGVVAASLVFGATGAASAQSSFGNLSSSSVVQPSPEPGPVPESPGNPEVPVSDKDRLARAMEGYLLRVGNRITPNATQIAQEYADEGALGNIDFWGKNMRSLWEPRGLGTITKVPEDLVEEVISELDRADGEVNVSLRAGAAAAYADGIYYVVEFYA